MEMVHHHAWNELRMKDPNIDDVLGRIFSVQWSIHGSMDAHRSRIFYSHKLLLSMDVQIDEFPIISFKPIEMMFSNSTLSP